jgi:anhydro-N-acetylmuramic acid kinase
MMRMLDRALGDVMLKRAVDIGWNGDSMEAEGFAYYAVRSLLGLPITYPNTTGVSAPLSGGELCLPGA